MQVSERGVTDSRNHVSHSSMGRATVPSNRMRAAGVSSAVPTARRARVPAVSAAARPVAAPMPATVPAVLCECRSRSEGDRRRRYCYKRAESGSHDAPSLASAGPKVRSLARRRQSSSLSIAIGAASADVVCGQYAPPRH